MVLDVPWSSAEQKQAAEAFGAFLLSTPIQERAMADGFRPANASVSIRSNDSPWMKFQDKGLKADLPGRVCEPPNAEIIENLLLGWQRSQAGR